MNQHLLSRWSQIKAEPVGVSRADGFAPVVLRREDVTGPTGLQEGDQILTPEGLSEWLQIPVSTVRDLCRKRSQKRDKHPLPFFHVGKRVRFNKTEVMQWLSKLEQARKS
ncbi:MAG: helix-turn-helix domain-containing protein [Acidobacteriia bacterium]|nr:helix-turn-helix domain-containing protein [Terriglobia bacterium]